MKIIFATLVLLLSLSVFAQESTSNLITENEGGGANPTLTTVKLLGIGGGNYQFQFNDAGRASVVDYYVCHAFSYDSGFSIGRVESIPIDDSGNHGCLFQGNIHSGSRYKISVEFVDFRSDLQQAKDFYPVAR